MDKELDRGEAPSLRDLLNQLRALKPPTSKEAKAEAPAALALCPECHGYGFINRRVPRNAVGFQNNPGDWTTKRQLCWRCRGDGEAMALGPQAFLDSCGKLAQALPLPWSFDMSPPGTPPARKTATVYSGASDVVCRINGPMSFDIASAITTLVNNHLEKRNTPPNLVVGCCRVCGGIMKEGVCVVPGIYGCEDFGGDRGQPGTTWSEGPGDGKLRVCWKCESCGHSFIPGKFDLPTNPINKQT